MNTTKGTVRSNREQIEFFSRFASSDTYRDASVLFGAGDDSNFVYMIEAGYLKICHLSEDGDVVAMLLHGPGDIVGAGGVLDNRERAVFAITVGSRCKIWKMPGVLFMEMLQKDSMFAVEVARNLANRMRNLDHQVMRHTLEDSRTRMAGTLYDIAVKIGKQDDNMTKVKITHQELGEMTATCRQTVTEWLGSLKKEGILETRKGEIDVLDMEMLRAEATGKTACCA